ncbi:hypothetical protein GOBAR_DD02875 [Gossypium barbadense]|nr:hypothetical protein GOBAR_DD02875 [Gossypium barbadense]
MYYNNEVQSIRDEVIGEIGIHQEITNVLYQLLFQACHERGEAKQQLKQSMVEISKLKKLLNKLLPSSKFSAETNSSDDVSLTADDCTHRKTLKASLVENSGCRIPVRKCYSIGNVIDALIEGRPLPVKGRLFEAVIDTPPLLETLMIMGHLPNWRNPPPLPFNLVVNEISNSQTLNYKKSSDKTHSMFRLNPNYRFSRAAAATIFNNEAHNPLFIVPKVANTYFCFSSTSFADACKLFDEMSDLDVVSATSIIGTFSKQHLHKEAIYLFTRMLFNNIRPTEFTFGTVIHSSTLLKDLNIGKQLHGCTIKSGLNSNVFVGSASLDLYSKLSTIEEARKMLRERVMPNESTFSCVIITAANIGAIGKGRSLHGYVFKCLGDKLNVFIGNALISFYAKCGNMEDSLLVFDKLRGRNVVSWNALVCGYAQNGRGIEAIELFERMIVSGLKPNDVTILGMLWACSHAGLVTEGYSYFNKVRHKEPNLLKPEHYGCMVDMLARSGRFKEAEEFIQRLPFEPGIGFWKALLGGCQIHSNVKLGEFAARKIMALDPVDVSSYIMLSNAYAAAGRWEIASTVRKEIKEKQMKRIPGCSWIEIRNEVHVFLNKDCKHCQIDDIYRVLKICIQHSLDCEAVSILMEFSI